MSTYDFNKREETEYSHSYDYLGGMGLGREEVEAERVRKSKLGTYDLLPIAPPSSVVERGEVIKTARLVHASKSRETLLAKISEVKDSRTSFLWNTSHPNHAYFEWVLHCLDREVNDWESIRPGDKPSVSQQTSATLNPPRIGDLVEVKNLRTRPELNGKSGKIVREENGRFLVEFSDIVQTVSVSKSNCFPLDPSRARVPSNGYPVGLKVEVIGLASEAGRLLNGSTGYIVEFKSDSGRYLVRLEGDTDFKSLKEENLFVLLPPGWEQRKDESSGKPYYVHAGAVHWEHPILKSSKKRSEFIDPEDDEPVNLPTDFDREEFLQQEKKRLKLDKKEKSRGMTKERIQDQLDQLRSLCPVIPAKSSSPLYVGTPRILLSNIESAESEDERTKFLFVALCIMLDDYMQLKFNKTQLAGLSFRLDELIESGGPPFDPAIVAWIKSGMQIAIPVSYTVY
jgi:hypothetical protein